MNRDRDNLLLSYNSVGLLICVACTYVVLRSGNYLWYRDCYVTEDEARGCIPLAQFY